MRWHGSFVQMLHGQHLKRVRFILNQVRQVQIFIIPILRKTLVNFAQLLN